MSPAYVGTKLEGRPLTLDSICDICGKYRNRGKHDKCSKIRQQRYEAGLKQK